MLDVLSNETVKIYLTGVVGSIAIELAALLKDLGINDWKLPPRYKTIVYPVVRLLFTAFAAGPLAVYLAVKPDWTAFYVGISAPLLFDRAAAGIAPSLSPPGLDSGSKPPVS